MVYDWIIVGGGPSGFTCASLLPGNSLVLEKRRHVGGCHRAQYKNGFFSEHGPRVYSGSFVNLDRMMRSHIGIRWNDVFTKTRYAPDDLDGKRWYQWMSWRALLMSTVMTLTYLVGIPIEGSMRDALAWWRVPEDDIEKIDTVCRFSDGAGIARYRQSQFVSGFDWHTLYNFYEPKVSLDESLWAPWRDALSRRGVVIETGVEVSRVIVRDGAAQGVVTTTGRTIPSRGVILCLPPVSLSKVLRASGVYDFRDLANATKYIPYYSYCLHFEPGRGSLLNAPGFVTTPWGLIYIEMPFTNHPTRILSVAITKSGARSPRTGKRAKDMSNDAIITEILNQIPLTSRAKSTLIRVVPATEKDSAYVHAANTHRLPDRHPHVLGLGMVGCANGRSMYPFTSIENAIQNAMSFCGVTPSRPWTIRSLGAATIVAVLLAWFAFRMMTR